MRFRSEALFLVGLFFFTVIHPVVAADLSSSDLSAIRSVTVPQGTSSGGDFGGGVLPSVLAVLPGQTGSCNINIQPLNGFSSDITFSVSGIPSGVTAAFQPSNVLPFGVGSLSLVI